MLLSVHFTILFRCKIDPRVDFACCCQCILQFYSDAKFMYICNLRLNKAIIITMENMNIKSLTEKNTDTIIFDLGGVLLNLDFKRSIDSFINLGFTDVEKEMSRLLYAHPAGNNLSLFHKYEKGLIGSDEFRDSLRKLAGKSITDNDLDRAWTAMLLDLHEKNVELLRSVKGSYRIFLLSNTNAIHIETLHRRNDNGVRYQSVVELFEKVYYSHEVNMRKPDREIFDHVVNDSGLNAENALFIDDSAHNIEAARSAGMQAYHHKAGTSLEPLLKIS